MQHYIQSPIFDEKRGRMYVRYATYVRASIATNEVNFVILLEKEMDLKFVQSSIRFLF